MKKFKYSVIVPINTQVYNADLISRIHEVFSSTNIILVVMGDDVDVLDEYIQTDKIFHIRRIESKSFNYSFAVNAGLKAMEEELDFEPESIVAISESSIVFSMVQLDQTFKNYPFNDTYLSVNILVDDIEDPLKLNSKRLMLSVKHKTERILKEEKDEEYSNVPITILENFKKMNYLDERIFSGTAANKLIHYQLESLGLVEEKIKKMHGLCLDGKCEVDEMIIRDEKILEDMKDSSKVIGFVESNIGEDVALEEKLLELDEDDDGLNSWESESKITYIKKPSKNKTPKFINVQAYAERHPTDQRIEPLDVDMNFIKESIQQRKRQRVSSRLANRTSRKENRPISVVNKDNNKKNIKQPVLLIMNNDIPTVASVSSLVNDLYEKLGKVDLLINTKNMMYYKILGSKKIGSIFNVGDVQQCKLNLDRYKTIIRARDCRVPIPIKYERNAIGCWGDDLVNANNEIVNGELKPYCFFQRSKKQLPMNSVVFCTSFDIQKTKLNPEFIRNYNKLIKFFIEKRTPILLLNMTYEKPFIKNKAFSNKSYVYEENNLDFMSCLGYINQARLVITPQFSNVFWLSYMSGIPTYGFKHEKESTLIKKSSSHYNFYNLNDSFSCENFAGAVCTKILA